MSDNTNTSAGPAPEHGLCLLALDGGGVRGLSSLIILKEIMERIKVDQELESAPLPCEYFDLIGGAGTGGIIALMLGRLRLSVDDAIKHYIHLTKNVFSDKKGVFGIRHEAMFKATKFEKVMKEIISSLDAAGYNENARMLDQTSSCRTFVCAVPHSNMASPALFRTYLVRENQSIDCCIWEAARATSATPGLFKKVTISDGFLQQDFIGGDTWFNNPVAQLANEAAQEFQDKNISCILSLGTGQAEVIGLSRAGASGRSLSDDLLKVLKQIARDCEAASESFAKRFHNIPNFYLRLNVDQGLQNISLAESARADEVIQHTKQYLHKINVIEAVNAVVEALIEKPSVISALQLTQVAKPISSQTFTSSALPVSTRFFTGREDILQKMETCFFSQPSVKQQKQLIFVLYGFGGAGKTQIALKFIQSAKQRFSSIYWIDGSSDDGIQSSLQAIAKMHQVGKSHQDALLWLASDPQEWLLVIDNADDPDLDLNVYLPQCQHGNVIITSRNRATQIYGHEARVAELSHQDALELLFAVCPKLHSNNNEQLCSELVENLGYMALAIVQADSQRYIAKSTT